MTFEEWCDVNYPRVERLERTLMSIAWDAAFVQGQLKVTNDDIARPEEAKQPEPYFPYCANADLRQPEIGRPVVGYWVNWVGDQGESYCNAQVVLYQGEGRWVLRETYQDCVIPPNTWMYLGERVPQPQESK